MKQQPYYFHGVSQDGSRFTVAGQYEDEKLIVGIALCSKKDQFVKKLGRIKSYGRVLSKNGHGKLIAQRTDESLSEPIGAFVNGAVDLQKLTSEELKKAFMLC